MKTNDMESNMSDQINRKKLHTLLVFFVIFLLLLVHLIFSRRAGTEEIKGGNVVISGCPILPADNIWNIAVDNLPTAANSTTYINTIGASENIHADFGSGLWDGGPIGIPYVTVAGSQPKVNVAFTYDDESDPGPYPIPPNAPIEGGPNSDGDRHVLVLDRDNCILYELYAAYPQQNGTWNADSGAIYDLNSNDLRPDGWTSADAAGLPILPGLINYDEIVAGEINHAIRFTVPQTRRAYVWPARHYASSLTGSQYPPMGQRFRLKAGFNVSGYSAVNQIILRAMKKYGLILADNGSAWYISGIPDERWNNSDLHQLDDVLGSDFEAVDVSALMVDPDSGRVLRSNPPDLNSDGRPDILWRHNTSGQNAVWYMNDGVRTGLDFMVTVSDINWKLVGSADFNNDGKDDLLWRHSTNGKNLVWYMNGSSRTDLTYLLPVTDTQWDIVGCADFNSDGKKDILWRHKTNGKNLVWFMDVDVRTGTSYLISVTDLNWDIVGCADFNSDGQTDILWRHKTNGKNLVWYLNGTVRSGLAYLIPVTDPLWKIGGCADFNNDGKTDVLWRHYGTGKNLLWYLNGTVRSDLKWLTSLPDSQWEAAN